MDAWLLLRDIESGGRAEPWALYPQGPRHCPFEPDSRIPVDRSWHRASRGLFGRSRYAHRLGARDAGSERRIGGDAARQEIERKQLLLQRKRMVLDAQIAALQLDLETEEQESQQLIAQEKLKIVKWERDRGEMARSRFADKAPPESFNGSRKTPGDRK